MFPELLTTTIGNVGKVVVSKATGQGYDAASKSLGKALAGPPAPLHEAVVRAIAAAQADLKNLYFPDDSKLGRDLEALLGRPKYAEEVARIVLFRGRLDVELLRDHYFRFAEGEEASERWKTLAKALRTFCTQVDNHLRLDPLTGPIVRGIDVLSGLTGLSEGQQILIEQSQLLVAVGKRQADLLTKILASQEARLGELTELLASSVAEQGGDRPVRSSAEETEYLRVLREHCDRLPLANLDRSVGSGRRAASLAKVYVELDTMAGPNATRIAQRLGVPADEQAEVVAAWRKHAASQTADRLVDGQPQRSSADAPGLGALFAAEVDGLRGPDEKLPDDHPLRPWAEDAKTLADAARRPLSAIEALGDHHRLVLLGDPGSGKSTFVDHLGHTLAGELLGRAATGLLGESIFPVRVVLRKWSQQLEPEDFSEARLAEKVVEACADLLPVALPAARLKERFRDPRTLVLFDGLDEVPTGSAAGPDGERFDRRRRIVEAMQEFAIAHPDCRILVTCRVKPYESGEYQLEGWPSARLAPLDDARQRRFTELWYTELTATGSLLADRASSCRERLLDALTQRDELREMARTPLLLTMLARVNARAALPEDRVELYEECVQQLLWEWEKEKEEGGLESLARLLELPTGERLKKSAVERALQELTFALHGTSGEDEVDVPAEALEKALRKVHPDVHQGKEWASRVVALMAERSGLLIAKDQEIFRYPHRSFQEYLACRGLLRQDKLGTTAARLAGEDIWREVVLLSLGWLSNGSHTEKHHFVLRELLPKKPESRADWRRVLVAGHAWHELGAHRVQGQFGEELGAQIPPRLTELMQHKDLPAAQRLEAGLLLADLGVVPEDLDDFVEIPADVLPYAFRIGKYPVTNWQYRRFIEAGGYDEKAPWWSEVARREILDSREQLEGGGWPMGPRLESNYQLNRATQPVVGVSWYEAMAYCEWLTGRLRAEGMIGEDVVARLPTEEEWNHVAAGPEGRKYPWGNNFEAWRVNSAESGLGQPSPVAMHPGGATSAKVFDLAGNVWEWTIDRGEHDRSRKIAGGAYYNKKNNINSASRLWLNARNWHDHLGFRVLLAAPISHNSDS